MNLQSLPPADRLQALRQRRARVKLSQTRRLRSREARRQHGPRVPSWLAYTADLKKISRATWDLIVAELDVRRDALPQSLRFKLYDYVQARVPPAAAAAAKRVSKAGLEDTKRVLGIDPRIDPGVGPELDSFVIENVRLITNMVDDQHDEIKKLLDANFGRRHEEVAELLEDAFDVSEARARLIARDQTLKLAGDLTRIRQTNAGIDSYVWTTSGDERVREEHALLDGEVFSWNAPPTAGHPGQDFQCRCTAYPVVPGLDDSEG